MILKKFEFKEDLPDLDFYEVIRAHICPYCGKRPQCIPSSLVYGKNYGFMFRCEPCDAYVGCHKKTVTPLGRLANKELRYYKKMAHAFLDPLWESRKMSRSETYTFLSKEMKIHSDFTHVGMFNVKQCKEAINILKTKLDEYKLEPNEY